MNLAVDQDSAPADSAASSSAQFNYDNNNGGGLFRMRSGGSFFNPAITSGGGTYTPVPGVTYDLWFVLDASAATYSLYLADPNSATDGDVLTATPTLLYEAGTTTGTLLFRNGGYNTPGAALDPIDTGEGSSTGTLPQTEVDDIYVDPNGQYLVNPTPTPEPGTLALLGLGGSLLALRTRRNRKS